MAEGSTTPTPTPSHYYIDEKWDAAIDTTLRRVVYGSLVGGILALTLFSTLLVSSSPYILPFITIYQYQYELLFCRGSKCSCVGSCFGCWFWCRDCISAQPSPGTLHFSFVFLTRTLKRALIYLHLLLVKKPYARTRTYTQFEEAFKGATK